MVSSTNMKKESSPKKSTVEDEQKSTFFDKLWKKDSEAKEKKSKSVKAPIKPSLSEITQNQMKESDSFLKDEVEKYHDVRPVIKNQQTAILETVASADTKMKDSSKKSKVVGEKKVTLLDKFRKKGSEEKEIELESGEAALPLTLTEITQNQMRESDTFLKDEVEKYHDVRPVIKDQQTAILETVDTINIAMKDSPKKSKIADEKKVAFLDKFKKMGSEEKEIKIKSVEASLPLTSSEITQNHMIESDSFLKDEVEKYHDVRPVIRDQQTSIQEVVSSTNIEKEGSPKKSTVEDEKKSTFFHKIWKKDSEAKEKKSKSVKTPVKPSLSEITQNQMKESDSFLKDEVEKYHDVRPVIKDQQTAILETVPTTHIEMNVSPRKSKVADERKVAFFDKFKKKGSEEKKIGIILVEASLPLTSSDITQNHIIESESFLKDEVEKYHDVRPVISDQQTSIQEVVSSTHVEKEGSPKRTTVEDEKKSTYFDKLWKKDSKAKEKESKSVKAPVKPSLSEITRNQMKESDSFLKDEVKKYHDVRPVIKDQQTAILETVESTNIEMKDSSKKSKVTGEKKVALLDKFKKKGSEEKEIKLESGEAALPLTLTEIAQNHMRESDTFLKDEVEKYHDVRPVIRDQQTVTHGVVSLTHIEKEGSPKKSKVKDEKKSTFFDKLWRKDSSAKEKKSKSVKAPEKPLLSEIILNEMRYSNNFLKDEVDNYHDVRPVMRDQPTVLVKTVPIPDIKMKDSPEKSKVTGEETTLIDEFKKKGSEEKEILLKSVEDSLPRTLSEIAQNQIRESDTFLKDEVKKYHDVHPIIRDQQTVIQEVASSTHIVKEDFPVKLKVEDEKKSTIFDKIWKRDPTAKEKKSKSVKAPVKPPLGEIILNEMRDSNNFLKDEVDNYHDVRPFIRDQQTIIVQTVPDIEIKDSPKKSKEAGEKKSTLSDKFKKKGSEQKEVKLKSVETSLPLTLSELNQNHMRESDTFLKDEVANYHDVHPVIRQKQTLIQEVVSSTHIEKGGDPKKSTVEDEKKSTFFDKLWKKDSEAKEKKSKSVKGTVRPSLSEITQNQMIESDSFLKDEVEMYHDVRPVIKDHKTVMVKTVPIPDIDIKDSPKKSKVAGEKKSTLLDNFKKKGSEEKEIKLKSVEASLPLTLREITQTNMRESDTFLKDEVEKYHDVRPVIRDQRTSTQEVVSSTHIEKECSPKKSTVGDEKKSTFFDKLWKKDSEAEERKSKSVEAPVKLSLSEITQNQMKKSDNFLKNEVDKYHDARPVIRDQQTVRQETVPSTDIEMKESSEISKVVGEKKVAFLDNFKEKSSKEKKIELESVEASLPLTSSEIAQNHMRESDTFLKDEVERYHDVRPIIKDQQTLIQQVVSSTNVEKEDLPKMSKVEDEKKSTFFDKLWKKDSEAKGKKSKSVKAPVKPSLSEITKNQMRESDSFLKDEVEKYHDVRAVIRDQKTSTQEVVSSTHFEKEGSSKMSKVENEKKSPFLDKLWRKDSTATKQKSKSVKAQVKPPLSESILNEMRNSNNFLKDEVENYHDVRPVIRDQQTVIVKTGPLPGIEMKDSPKKTKVAGGKKSTLFGKFKKNGSEEKEIKLKSVEASLPLTLSETTQNHMIESDSFLKDEVEKYHDVRPVIRDQQTLIQEVVSSTHIEKGGSPKKSTVEDEKKSTFFDKLWKKDSDAKEKKSNSVKAPVKPSLSEITQNKMKKSYSFLKEEVEKYHDVRPVIKDQQNAILETVPSTNIEMKVSSEESRVASEMKDALLDKFTKMGSEEKEVELKSGEAALPPTLSENTQYHIRESNTFLKDEVEKYHDVRPVIRDQKTSTQEVVSSTHIEKEGSPKMSNVEDEKKSTFFDKLWRKDSTAKEKKTKSVKAPVKTPLSEIILIDMRDSNNFLKDEVDNYHDVRPVIRDQQTVFVETIPLPDIEIEDSPKKSKVAGEKKSTLFDKFKKKGSEEKEIKLKSGDASLPLTLCEITQNHMRESDTFLKDEVQKYHDVRPVIRDQQTLTQEVVASTHIEKEGSPKKSEVEDEKKSTFFDKLWRKDSTAKEKKSKSVKAPVKPTLSEIVVIDMRDSNNFLKDEVDNYHDVRPVMRDQQTVIVKTVPLPDIEITDSPEKSKVAGEKKSTLLDIFKKKGSEEKEIKLKSVEASLPLTLSEITQNHMRENDTFLKDEVEKYHDVRPVISDQQTVIVKTEPLPDIEIRDSPKKSKVAGETKSALLDKFKKKGSEEKEIKQKSVEASLPLTLSEITQNHMRENDTFLKDEVEKYHDVRPVIRDQQKLIQEVVLSTHIDKEAFSNKSSVEDEKKSTFFDKFWKKDPEAKEKKSKSVKAPAKPSLSEITQFQMKESDSFLKDEVEKYHDVRPVIKVQQPAILKTVPSTDIEMKDSSKKLTGEKEVALPDKFQKNGSKKKIVESKSGEAALPVTLSEITQYHIRESDSFLKDEVEKFHDVRSVIRDQQTPTQEVVSSTHIEKEGSPKMSKVEDEKKSTFFDKLWKKDSTAKEKKSKSVKAPVQPPMSEIILNNMRDSNNFLKDEVDNYHDVRPVMKDQQTVEVRTVPLADIELKDSPKISRVAGEKKSTLLDKFKKRGSEEKEIKLKSVETSLPPTLSEITLNHMRESDTFLKDEVEKYHDVRPVFRDQQTSIEKVMTPSQIKMEVSPKMSSTKDGKKKTFFDKFKKKGSEERDIKRKSSESSVHPMISASTVNITQDCSSFLKEEVERYHDVRSNMKEITVITYDQDTSRRIERKGSKKENIEKQERTAEIKEPVKEESSALFGLFSKKSKPVAKKNNIANDLIEPLSPETIQDIRQSSDFLEFEISKYHDVRPGAKKVSSNGAIPETIQISPAEASSPVIEPVSDRNIFILGESDSHLEVSLESNEKKFVAQNILDDMKDEPAVRTITTTVTEEIIPRGERVTRVTTEVITGTIQLDSEALADLSKLEDQINSKLDHIRKELPKQSNVNVKKLLKDEKIDIENRSMPEHQRSEEFITKTKTMASDTTDTGHVLIREIVTETNDFKSDSKSISGSSKPSKTEVSPINRERITITEKHFVKEGGYLNETFGVEKVETDQNQEKAEDTDRPLESHSFSSRKLGKYEYSGELNGKHDRTKNKEIQPKLSEDTLEHMISTSNFLREEVAKYHDVKFTAQKVEPEVKIKEKGTKFFGLFSKKKSQDKDNQPKSKDNKKDGKKIKKDKSLTEDRSKESDSKDFPKGETDRCQESEKVKHDSKEESGSFFGLFSKKTKLQGKGNDVDKNIVRSLSQETLQNMKDSSEFLQKEVTYHDVRPTSDTPLIQNVPERNVSSLTSSEVVSEFPKKEIVDVIPQKQCPYEYNIGEFEEGPKRTVTSTTTKESIPRGERISKVTTEVITSTIQLDPSVLSDISKLEDEINAKLNQIRAETSDFTITETYHDKGRISGTFEEFHQSFEVPTTGISETQEVTISDANCDGTKKETLQTIGSPFGSHDKHHGSEIPDTQLFGKISTYQPSAGSEQGILSDEVLKAITTSNDFLISEVKNYDDPRPEITTDLDDDQKKGKSSGLFGIFSRREKSGSPKVEKKIAEKQKVEKHPTGHIGFMEKVGERLPGFPGGGRKGIFKVNQKDIQCVEGLDKGVDGTFKDKGQSFDVTMKDNISELEKTDNDEERKKSITKQTPSEIVDNAKCETQKSIQAGLNRVQVDADNIKTQSLNFADDLLQSFNEKLENTKTEYLEHENMIKTSAEDSVRDFEVRTENIKKGVSDISKTKQDIPDKLKFKTNEAGESVTKKIASFEQTIDEKFSDTMKLTEEFSKKSKQLPKPSLCSFIENERRFIENDILTTQEENERAERSQGDFSSTGRLKKQTNESSQITDDTKKTEGHLELRVASTIQNVEDAAKSAGKKIIEDASDIGHTVTIIEKRAESNEFMKGTEDLSDKTSKNSKSFLNKFGLKITGKGDTSKTEDHSALEDQTNKGAIKKLTSEISQRVDQKVTKIVDADLQPSVQKSDDMNSSVVKGNEDIPEKSTKKSKSFLGRLGMKISGKGSELEKPAEVGETEESATLVETGNLDKVRDGSSIQKLVHSKTDYSDVKQKTLDFLGSESLRAEDSRMTRATSDYGGQIKTTENELSTRISEANIDLSDLPTNINEYMTQSHKTSSYVTSPTLTRRTLSTRFSKGERPEVMEITYDSTLESSSDDSYIVTEPDENYMQKSSKSPLFHIDSEEDSCSEVYEVTKERQDSTKSNVLEILTEHKLESLLTDLTENLKASDEPLKTKLTKQLEEHKKESQADVELIEQKLRDLDKALDSLEKVNLDIETDTKNDAMKEKKLRRVERKFERMASDAIGKELEDGKDVKMTSPEIEEKRETDYRSLVSQLSTEEISDFQRDYSHLWDENTFSKSSDWESKTPDSQADAQELPQGSDEAASGSTSKESTTPAVKAEGEEGTEKDDAGYGSKVADQHQLSEEMKALLKELEKESKQ